MDKYGIHSLARNSRLVGRFFMTIGLVFLTYLFANCIEPNNSTLLPVGEHIQIMTDRNLYAVQEQVYYRVNYSCAETLQDMDWSKVLYVELMNEDGQAELQQKLPLGKDGANGSFKIPKELLTGNYFLRAYTKWMINFGPEAFSYAKIVVISPFSEQVFAGQDINVNEAINLKDNGPNYHLTKDFTVSTDKRYYKTRERVKLKIDIGEPQPDGSGFTVSVVKTGLLDSLYMGGSRNTAKQTVPLALNTVEFLPESRGLSFSGTMNTADGQPSKERKTVNLSVIGDNPYFAQTLTNARGEFYFTLPEQAGELNLFLCPAGNEDNDVTFKVNNGFANFHYPVKTEAFALTETQEELAKELVINSQITSIYPEPGVALKEDTAVIDSLHVYFYGTPEQRLYLDEYIVLPNLGEVFFELVPNVLLLKKKKESYLKVVNDDYWESSLPLVLLDHIPIYDLSTILGIHSQKFEWIDVINTNYLKGNMIYSGIISIFSRNNDIAGAELPGGGAFFSYKSFEEQKNTTEEGHAREQKNIPDLRNCLYWNPNYPGAGRQHKEVEFSTSDNTGEYTVLIRKTNSDGTGIELNMCKFRVE